MNVTKLVADVDAIELCLDHLRLFYQPIVSLSDGRVVAAEALVRWQHPSEGVLPPAFFLPEVFASDLRVPFSQWLFREAFEQFRRWRDGGIRGIRIAVNLSLAELKEPSLVHLVRSAVGAAEIEPEDVELEITEKAGLLDECGVRETVALLHSLGFRISIDDFGAGDASLRYLLDLPATTLKLDRSILHGVPDVRYSIVLAGIARTAHDLGCELVVEGIEDRAQEQFLLRNGVRFGQGYYVGGPMVEGQLRRRLLSTQPTAKSILRHSSATETACRL